MGVRASTENTLDSRRSSKWTAVPISAETKRPKLYMNVINSRYLIFLKKLNIISPLLPIQPDFNIYFGLNYLKYLLDVGGKALSLPLALLF